MTRPDPTMTAENEAVNEPGEAGSGAEPNADPEGENAPVVGNDSKAPSAQTEPASAAAVSEGKQVTLPPSADGNGEGSGVAGQAKPFEPSPGENNLSLNEAEKQVGEALPLVDAHNNQPTDILNAETKSNGHAAQATVSDEPSSSPTKLSSEIAVTATSPPEAAAPDTSLQLQLQAQVDEQSQRIQQLLSQLSSSQETIKSLEQSKLEAASSNETEKAERAKAEAATSDVQSKCQQLQRQMEAMRTEHEEKLQELSQKLAGASEENATMAAELNEIKIERDAQTQKEIALTSSLNAAKKKEGVKKHEAEHYESQVQGLEEQLEETEKNLSEETKQREQLQKDIEKLKTKYEQRTQQLKASLTEERGLNEERKRKMKSFVEKKMEEIRSNKEDNAALQNELDQTNKTLLDINQKYKQIHAQWVQSQTRNRELLRDMNRMKKDSEKLHKSGGNLEAKLSRSAMEMEEHKNKRLTTKNELMTVLKQLESERNMSNKLRDSIKFTFTPKAISQQQIIREALQEFEDELQKLASRLGQTLTPPDDDWKSNSPPESSEFSVEDDDNASEALTNTLLHKLEGETQLVSQSVMAFTRSVERMHSMLNMPVNRTCATAFQELLLTVSQQSAGSAAAAISPSAARRNGTGSRYGQISQTQH